MKKTLKDKAKGFFTSLFTKKSNAQKTIDAKNNLMKNSKQTRMNKVKNTVKNNKKKIAAAVVVPTAVAVGGNALKKNEKPPVPKRRPKSIKPKNYGLGGTDDLSKSKVKQGPPKGIAKKAPVKKKSKSNISGSSSYDADFTKKGLEKRGLSPKARMSKENLAKTTSAKNKKNAAGQDFGGKKKKKAGAAFYESNGGKIKMAKGYSKGGSVFTGR